MTPRPKLTTVPGLVAAILLAGAFPSPAQPVPVVARASGVTGRVLLAPANRSAAFTLASGFILNPGDQVDTRGGGRLVIDLSDGSVIVVQPETVLTIKDFRAAESLRELFQITVGIVRVKINHFVGRPNPYRMNSPTASIAVRGTEFSVIVSAAGDTRVEVYQGAVEVASIQDPSRKTLVESGSAVLVRAGQDLLRYPLIGGPDKAPRGPGSTDREIRAPGLQSGAGTPPARDARPDPDHNVVYLPAGGAVVVTPPPPRDPAHPTPGAATGPTNHPHSPAQYTGDPRPGGDEYSPRSTASTYERYISGLTELGQVPFINRYNAFPEMFLDSFENPAYATEFHQTSGRLFLLPTWSGAHQLDENSTAFSSGGNRPADSSLSPQFSMFSPIAGGRFVVGANATASHIDSSATASSSSGTFSSFSALVAAPFGKTSANSLGFSIERLRGSGSLSSGFIDPAPPEQYASGSSIAQTRFTLGLSRQLFSRHKLGVFYRYGLIDASDVESQHLILGQPVNTNATRSGGHSSEFGLRLRGVITPRLFYGVSASWLGLALSDSLQRIIATDSTQRDRLKRGVLAAGAGFLLDRRTVLTADVSGGISHSQAARRESSSSLLVEDGCSTDRTISAHIAIQRDLSHRFFVSASYLNVWRSTALRVLLLPDSFGRTTIVQNTFFPLTATLLGPHYSDFGAGWRIRPNLTAQYVYSTDYGATSGSHAVMFRYTFRSRGE